MLLTAESESPYSETYVYIENFLLEHNMLKRTMESDSTHMKTYINMYFMYVSYVL